MTTSKWTIYEIDGRRLAGHQPSTFAISPGGSLRGFDDCNQYGAGDEPSTGPLTVTGSHVEILGGWSTAAACPTADGAPVSSGRFDLRPGVLVITTDFGPVLLASTAGAPPHAPRGQNHGRIADRHWIVTEVDGVPAAGPASFDISADGRLVGFDGCDAYGLDLVVPRTGTTVPVTSNNQWPDESRSCPGRALVRVGPGDWTIDMDTLAATTSDGRRLTAIAEDGIPTSEEVAAVPPGLLGHAWAIASVDGTTVISYDIFQIRDDGAVLGHFGCVAYAVKVSFDGTQIATVADLPTNDDSQDPVNQPRGDFCGPSPQTPPPKTYRVDTADRFDVADGGLTIATPDGHVITAFVAGSGAFGTPKTSGGPAIDVKLGGGDTATPELFVTVPWGDGPDALPRPADDLIIGTITPETVTLGTRSSESATGPLRMIDRATGGVSVAIYDGSTASETTGTAEGGTAEVQLIPTGDRFDVRAAHLRLLDRTGAPRYESTLELAPNRPPLDLTQLQWSLSPDRLTLAVPQNYVLGQTVGGSDGLAVGGPRGTSSALEVVIVIPIGDVASVYGLPHGWYMVGAAADRVLLGRPTDAGLELTWLLHG